MQVTNIALQTDSCDTLYVTKNTLVDYYCCGTKFADASV